MKKYLYMIMLIVMMAAALTACGGKKKSDTPSVAETTPEETNPENGLPLSKQPDPDAPVLASIILYAPTADGKVEAIMDAADELTEDNILTLLMEYGTIGENTTFVSLTTEDSSETMAAGPGGGSGSTVQNGTLTLSDFSAGEGLDQETAKQAVIDTFKENYGLGDVDLVLE